MTYVGAGIGALQGVAAANFYVMLVFVVTTHVIAFSRTWNTHKEIAFVDDDDIDENGRRRALVEYALPEEGFERGYVVYEQ